MKTTQLKDNETLNNSTTAAMEEKRGNFHHFQSEPVINDPNNRTLAMITLDIGEKTEVIKICHGDDVRKIAIEITNKHNLTEEAIDFLIENINNQIKANNMKPEFEHTIKSSCEEENNETNVNNKSLAEIQYENWQRILQQKSKLKPQKQQDPNFMKHNEYSSFQSAPQMNLKFYRDENHGRDKTPSIYEKLYQAAVSSQNKKEEKSRVSIEEKLRRDKSATFKPKINHFKGKNNNNTSVSPVRTPKEISDYLYNDGKKYMENRKKKEKMKEEMELEKCSFKPIINKTSETLVTEKQNRPIYKNIHEKLYKGGLVDKDRKEKWRKINFDLYYPFQPLTNNKDKDSSISTKKEDIEKLIERLANTKKIQEKSFPHLNSKNSTDFDKKTGKPLFHPVITKDKYYYDAKAKENTEYEQVIKELTDQLSKKKDNNQNLEKKQKNNEKVLKKPKKDKKINENPLDILIKEMFDLMDDDKDQWISSDNIDVSAIDPYFLEIIEEILYDMEERKQKLDISLFIKRIKEFGLEARIHKVIFFN